MTREHDIMTFLNGQPSENQIRQRLIREAHDHDRLLLRTRQTYAQQQGDGYSIGEQQHH